MDLAERSTLHLQDTSIPLSSTENLWNTTLRKSEYLKYEFSSKPFWRNQEIDPMILVADMELFIRWFGKISIDELEQSEMRAIYHEFQDNFIEKMCTGENEGVRTRSEAAEIRRLLTSMKPADLDHPHSVTANMFLALKESAQLSSDAKVEGNHLITVQVLEDWHRVLFSDTNVTAWSGILRSGIDKGVVARHDISIHQYPESCEIPKAMQQFVDIYCEMAPNGSVISDVKVADTVKCASWSLCVLLGIHPFLDGNGRLSRLFCNYVLSSLFPFDIPVYNVYAPTKRQDYIDALLADRNCSCTDPENCISGNDVICLSSFGTPVLCQGPRICLTTDEVFRKTVPSTVATMVLESCWYTCRQFHREIKNRVPTVLQRHPFSWPLNSSGLLSKWVSKPISHNW